MKNVLKRMYDAEYITKEEYNEALDYNIVEDFRKKKTRSRDAYPALTEEIQERAKVILVEVLAKQHGHSMKDLKEDDDLHVHYQQLEARSLETNVYAIHSKLYKEMEYSQ